MIGYLIGRILLTEAALLLVPLVTALLYKESPWPFLLTILLLITAGLPLGFRKPTRTTFFARDGIVVVALTWIAMSAFGALPFVFSGDIPNYIDAFFETVSGFTTTGATILTAVEPLRHSCLMWRSFAHWVGGMGVLVFVLAILPMNGGNSMHLVRAETPGPTAGKLVSRMGDSAKILYSIYFLLTVILILLLLAGGMPLFDSLIHAFGTAGTGGFSSRNASVGAYDSAYIDVVLSIGMMVFSINFNLYYFLLIRRFRDVFRSDELRTFLAIVAAATLTVAVNISHMYESFATSLRHALFQVTTIISTTGYGTVDFNTWPTLSKVILVGLMFIGGCAGSTAGGMKVSRFVMLAKASFHDMRKMLHPNAVSVPRFEDKPLSEKTIRGVHQYLTMYICVFSVSLLLLSLEGFDLVTTFTSVATCINNVGPGLELVGPTGNFSVYSGASKLLLSLDMLMGRLDIFPMLLLFSPSVWHRPRQSAPGYGK